MRKTLIGNSRTLIHAITVNSPPKAQKKTKKRNEMSPTPDKLWPEACIRYSLQFKAQLKQVNVSPAIV
jgi:hypothetical protein